MQENAHTPDPRKLAVAALVLVTLLSVLPFSPYLDAPFFFDDIHTIRDNPHLRNHLSPLYFIRHPESASRLPTTTVRPLLTFTYALDYHRAGASPAAFRITNLCIHILNALLVFALTASTRKLKPMALLCALLFALHPLASVDVAYVSNRSTLLSGTFYLAGLLIFARAEGAKPSAARAMAALVVVAVLFGLGLLCKSVAATLPAAIVLWRLAFGGKDESGSGRRGILFTATCVFTLFIMLVLFIVFRAYHSAPTFFPPQRPWEVWQYAAAQMRAFWTYARLLLWPVNLSIEHQAWAPAAVSDLASAGFIFPAAGLVLLAGLSLAGLRRFPEVSFSCLFAMLYLLPTSSVLPLSLLVNENRPYLSVLGVLWPLLYLLEAVKLRRPRPAAGVALLLLTSFICLLGLRGRDYTDEVTIWRDVVRKAPGLAGPHVNLGVAYSSYGRLGQAKQSFLWALRIDPCTAPALTNLGNIAYREGAWFDSAGYYYRAIKCDPGSVLAMLNLADLLMAEGQREAGAGLLEKALDLFPTSSAILGRLGLYYLEYGDDARRGLEYLQMAAEFAASRTEALKWKELLNKYTEGDKNESQGIRLEDH